MKPKALMIPFGYPGYPKELLAQFTDESKAVISGMGIDLTTTSRVDIYADAKKVAQEIRGQEFDFLIVLILSWLEAANVTETIQEYFSRPILLWSHTMFREGNERVTLGPIPGAGVIRESFEEMGLSFKFVYGMPGEEKVQRSIKSFANVAFARHQLTHSKIGLLGYASMGMYTGAFDHLTLKRDLGPEVEQLDQYVLIKKIEEMDNGRVVALRNMAKKNWEMAKCVTEKDLDITLKMYLALKDLVGEFGWNALTIKCQYELSKYYKHVPCVPLSMIGNELPCSCEGDIPLITTQLIMYYLSGGKIVTYCDLHTIDENSLLMGACGYAPFDLGEGKPRVDKTTVLYEGLANCTIYRQGQVTLARLAYTKARRFKMHITGGTAHRPKPFHEVGCLPYPSMEVTLEGSTEHFGQHLMSQHYAIIYGDIRHDLSEFCKLAGIEEVHS